MKKTAIVLLLLSAAIALIVPATSGAVTTIKTNTVSSLSGIVQVEINSPKDNASNLSGTVPISITASATFGIYSVQLFVDGAAWGDPVTAPDGIYHYTIPWSTEGYSAGKHVLTVLATDWSVIPPAIGTQVTSAPIVVYLDQSAPASLGMVLTSPKGQTLQRETITAAATLTGGTSQAAVQFYIDGKAWGNPIVELPYATTIDTTKLSDGTHIISAQATNPQAQSASDQVTIVVDNTMPTVLWWNGTNDRKVASNAILTLDASDTYGVASVQFFVDGKPYGALLASPDSGQLYLYTVSIDVTKLTSSWHIVTAQITDNAGNILTLTPSQGVRVEQDSYIPVLNYHQILSSPSLYDQTQAQASAELQYLKNNGYTSISLNQYRAWLSGQNIGIAKPVLITVDDGLKTEQAWDSLFSQYGMRGTMFVITGYADNLTPGDDSTNNMPWANIKALATNGRWDIAFHAGEYGHGSTYSAGNAIILGPSQKLTYSGACPYFYSCLGTIITTSRRSKTAVAETSTQGKTYITNEVNSGIAELKAKIPSADTSVFAAPLNDAGQWTNLYNDSTGAMQSWLPGFLSSKFQIVFTQTNPVQYAQASGTVGSLSGFNRRYRFEVHNNTTLQQFASALNDPAFAR